ncbi:MAG: hypothetical protein ACJAWO_002480, partial [Halieaceae bacterium]
VNSDNKTSGLNHQKHWDNAYTKTPIEKLGWYEDDLSPTLGLLQKTTVSKTDKVFIAGVGSTTLVDALLKNNYSNITATDISPVSIANLVTRIGSNAIETIVDDLANPIHLTQMESIDLWIDRAVLHFLIDAKDQKTYFDLLKHKVKSGGFVLLAEFGVGGAIKCCGLPIQPYTNKQFTTQLGTDFSLLETFNHVYHNPNGDPRKYIYSLFKRS